MNRPCHSSPIVIEKSSQTSLNSPDINNVCIQEQQSPIRRSSISKKNKTRKEKLLPQSPLLSGDTNSCYSPSILKNKFFSPTKVADIIFNPKCNDYNDDEDEEASTTSSKVYFVGGDVSETRHYDPKTCPISVCPPMPILFAFSKTAKRRRSLELYSSLISTSSNFSKTREVAAIIIQACFRGHQQYRHYQTNKAKIQIQRTQMLQIDTLENALQRIQTRHAEELERIEHNKQLEMKCIHKEITQDFEEQGRRKDALLAENIGAIHALRLENKELRQANHAAQVENLEMAQKNERVLQMTDAIHESIDLAERSQATFHADYAQIQEIASAWQYRIRQFQTTREEIEERLHAEQMIHKSTVRTIRCILRHINQQTTTLSSSSHSDDQKLLAKSITDTAIASMEAIARASLDKSNT
jgi:IQ calmodulin-binding motif